MVFISQKELEIRSYISAVRLQLHVKCVAKILQLCLSLLIFFFFWVDIDSYLIAIGLAPGGSITRHIYNQTIPNLHR